MATVNDDVSQAVNDLCFISPVLCSLSKLECGRKIKTSFLHVYCLRARRNRGGGVGGGTGVVPPNNLHKYAPPKKKKLKKNLKKNMCAPPICNCFLCVPPPPPPPICNCFLRAWSVCLLAAPPSYFSLQRYCLYVSSAMSRLRVSPSIGKLLSSSDLWNHLPQS